MSDAAFPGLRVVLVLYALLLLSAGVVSQLPLTAGQSGQSFWHPISILIVVLLPLSSLIMLGFGLPYVRHLRLTWDRVSWEFALVIATLLLGVCLAQWPLVKQTLIR